MAVNFDSDKVIVVHFPPGAGGHFLMDCLAISDNILHNKEEFAKAKRKSNWDEQKSLTASRTARLLSKKHKKHIEHRAMLAFGFQCEDDKSVQQKNATSLFNELTNQTKFFFTLMNHEHYENFLHYKNSKNIFITGCEKVCALRGKSEKKNQWWIRTESFLDDFDNKIFFNMDSCFDEVEFFQELKSVFQELKIKMVSKELVERMRLDFVNYIIT
jgi:hypothetical protein